MVGPNPGYLTAVQDDEGEARRWVATQHVLVDPDVQFGAPVVEGTHVQTPDVAASAKKLGVSGGAPPPSRAGGSRSRAARQAHLPSRTFQTLAISSSTGMLLALPRPAGRTRTTT
jgi:hypothetical protein